MVPSARILTKNAAPVLADRDYVLYWMIATRRPRWNFAMDRAVEWASELGKPLLVFEPLRCDYRWASDRTHRFVVDGMRDNAAALAGSPIGYYPYVEPRVGAGKGLLGALAERAAVVVTDEFPCFFLPAMVEAAGNRLDVKLEAVDSNGLLPVAAAGREFYRAYDFRRFLQRQLPDHLMDVPAARLPGRGSLPVFDSVPEAVTLRWPRALRPDQEEAFSLGDLPIDHRVEPISKAGGHRAALRGLRRFLGERIGDYGEQRNQVEEGATSELSAYFHFGHLSPHQVLDGIARRSDWTPWKLGDEDGGARRGFWNLGESIAAYLDQMVTWRELGYNFSFHRADYATYGSLPDWARRTLSFHSADHRPHTYSLEQFETASTHDAVWNAAQNELRERGRVHGYLRMLWGKKILHWSHSPRAALNIMIELNNKYAIDGRNPNSYSGIFWVLGRFDRAWGPARGVFGKVRYMSSKNTRRKLRLGAYLDRWSGRAS